MKHRAFGIIFGIIVLFLGRVPVTTACCWPGGYDVFEEELSYQPAPTSRALSKKLPPLKHYSVDVTTYANGRTTDSRLVDSPLVSMSTPIHIGALIGHDDRTRVKAPHTQGKWRPHGLLHIDFGKGRGGTGSGTMIHPHHVLTAGHCVHDDELGWARSLTFSAAQEGDSTPFGKANVVEIYTVKEWVKKKNPEWDLALLVLDRDLGFQTGWQGLLSASDKLLSTLSMTVSGYPGDKGTKYLYTMSGRLKAYNDERFTYLMDTNKGQSGASVWTTLTDNKNYCCGIHTNGQTDVENTATRISGTKFDLLTEWMKKS